VEHVLVGDLMPPGWLSPRGQLPVFVDQAVEAQAAQALGEARHARRFDRRSDVGFSLQVPTIRLESAKTARLQGRR
jgi:hypothetical protein